MQTPDNLAGRITEEIMIIFSRFDDVAEVPLPVDKYNLVYSHIYGVLDKRQPVEHICEKCGYPKINLPYTLTPLDLGIPCQKCGRTDDWVCNCCR